jgi:hypothetical protein
MKNTHLNHFHTYSRVDRENQLENDLTRAFAISLIENPLFLHEVLQHIFAQNNEKDFYSKQFSNINNDSKLDVSIQRAVTSLNSPTHLFAVSVTGVVMDTEQFSIQSHDIQYDPITDLVIEVNDVAIIFEVKPNDTDCISQLYNQALNAMLHHEDDWLTHVTPVDLSWNRLVELCIKVMNFQKLNGIKSKILEDFIDTLKAHNSRWLPIFSLSNLALEGNIPRVRSRIYQALQQGVRTPIHSDRLGFRIDQAWAEEILINVHSSSNHHNEEIAFSVFPGNTKAQGYHIFKNAGEPSFKKSINLGNRKFELHLGIHLKFSHFQKYFTGIDVLPSDFKIPLLTYDKFHKYSGRQYRGNDNWKYLEQIFDEHLNNDFDWREHCGWQENLIDSNRSYFDLSFGYELTLLLPYNFLMEIDKHNDDPTSLSDLFNEIGDEFIKIIE